MDEKSHKYKGLVKGKVGSFLEKQSGIVLTKPGGRVIVYSDIKTGSEGKGKAGIISFSYHFPSFIIRICAGLPERNFDGRFSFDMTATLRPRPGS